MLTGGGIQERLNTQKRPAYTQKRPTNTFQSFCVDRGGDIVGAGGVGTEGDGEEEAVTVDTSLYGNFANRCMPRPALPPLV